MLTKRNILGAILFLILVGEVTVGFANGLFTPAGLAVLLALYYFYFILIDAIVAKYRMDNLGIVMVNFALYSVLITGLLHGEIADYVLHPQNGLITTLIRIQCSLYPLFAFYLLRKLVPNSRSTVSLRKAVVMFVVFMLILTPSKGIGFIRMADTFGTAPLLASALSLLAVVAIIAAVRYRRTVSSYVSKSFMVWSVLLLVIGLIPGLSNFLFLLASMIIVTAVFMAQSRFRKSSSAY